MYKRVIIKKHSYYILKYFSICQEPDLKIQIFGANCLKVECYLVFKLCSETYRSNECYKSSTHLFNQDKILQKFLDDTFINLKKTK